MSRIAIYTQIISMIFWEHTFELTVLATRTLYFSDNLTKCSETLLWFALAPTKMAKRLFFLITFSEKLRAACRSNILLPTIPGSIGLYVLFTSSKRTSLATEK